MARINPAFDLNIFSGVFASFDRDNHVAMDLSHALLIFGTILAHKPKRILELGVGTASVSRLILAAINYNQCGDLICVDNWVDWSGQEPSYIQDLRNQGVNVIHSHERAYCASANKDQFDFLVSDADHYGDWPEFYVRMVKPDGFMFFHDTNNADLINLSQFPERLKQMGCECYHFTQNSRSEERCHRGLLMAINRKMPSI